MQVAFLRTDEFREKLEALMNEYDEFFWAVAWCSVTEPSKNFFRYREKFNCVSFGIAGCFTDPDFLDEMVGEENAKVISKVPSGIFHPKIYGFRSNERMAAIVGSANFTTGGLENNTEALVLIEGAAGESFFQDLVQFTNECASSGNIVTGEYAAEYKIRCEQASRLKRPPRDPMDGFNSRGLTSGSSDLNAMTWDEYVAKVKAGQHHDVEKSLCMLRVAQSWFASEKSFADLDIGKRKAICGRSHGNQIPEELRELDWGRFGSMQGFGDLGTLINENEPFLARAIDQIPKKGTVERPHYDAFLLDYVRAFESKTNKGRISSASRLLAMKRPDVFLCICDGNKEGAAKFFGFKKSKLSFENYWDWVVEPIRASDWYNTLKPSTPDIESELWESRVAMLDSLLYSK